MYQEMNRCLGEEGECITDLDRSRPGEATPWRKRESKSRDTSLDKLQAAESKVKPWTQEEVVLKKTPHVPREVPKEKLEEVELKPAKIEKKEIRRASLEPVGLKPVTKDITKEIKTEEKVTRREETGEEVYVEEEDSRFVKTSRKVDETVQRKDEPKPWTEEKVTLKKAKLDRKEIPKETIEPVELKSSKIVKKDIRRPSLEKVDLKPVPTTVGEKITEGTVVDKSQYVEEEDTSLLDISRREEVTKLRKEKIEKVEEKPEQPKPWTEEKVTLKKSKPVRKEIEKETLETVELKPSKIGKSPIRKPSLEKVDRSETCPNDSN